MTSWRSGGREETLRAWMQESVRRTGPALAPFCMSISRFNATLRDGDAVGLRVDAIPKEGVTGCGIQDIYDY
jgi:hypothetical protein